MLGQSQNQTVHPLYLGIDDPLYQSIIKSSISCRLSGFDLQLLLTTLVCECVNKFRLLTNYTT